ncbi:MAG: hypothetical protein U5J64_11065 [Halobacteriales archaeon]|nr:hypothetical protein [Halobacteriales archaeon]
MTEVPLPRHEKLAANLRESVGDDLRAVRVVAGTEDGAEHVHLYLRDDVDENYTDEEKERITDEVVYHTLGEGYRSNLFRSGEPRYTLYAFDEAFVFLFYEDEAHGTAVSVDTDFEGGVRELARDCLEELDPQSKI